MTRKRTIRSAAVLSAALAIVLGLAACGGDDGGDGGGASAAADAERAFLTGMVHHHGTAIEMSKIAQERGGSRFVKDLASDITSTQEVEIEQMGSIYARLFDGELKPDPMAHDGLGLSAEEAGMTHSPDTNAELEQADPFDRAFVDEMTPHHEGAVKMAEVVLEESDDEELTGLAEGIIDTQKQEIAAMNDFREREYGAPVPESAGASGGGDHGGH